MRLRRTSAAIGIVLALGVGASMANAQNRPAAPTAAEAATAALAQTLVVQLRLMTDEMDAAYRDARGDAVTARREMEVVAARYQPTFDAQAVALQNLMAADIAAVADEAERARLTAAAEQSVAVIRGLPAKMPDIMVDSHNRADRATREAAVFGALSGAFLTR